MVNRGSMTGTGQLPKFEEDMFHVPAKDFPYSDGGGSCDESFDERDSDGDKLHLLYGLTPCFERGGICGQGYARSDRQHQFNKVELVKFCKPEDSYEELSPSPPQRKRCLAIELLSCSEACTGDLGSALP